VFLPKLVDDEIDGLVKLGEVGGGSFDEVVMGERNAVLFEVLLLVFVSFDFGFIPGRLSNLAAVSFIVFFVFSTSGEESLGLLLFPLLFSIFRIAFFISGLVGVVVFPTLTPLSGLSLFLLFKGLFVIGGSGGGGGGGGGGGVSLVFGFWLSVSVFPNSEPNIIMIVTDFLFYSHIIDPKTTTPYFKVTSMWL
jgi:hypothetical protein